MARKNEEEEVPTCDHVKPSGNCCESPALRDDDYCYFHRLERERTKRRLRLARQQKPLELPSLEDRESIHLALGEVLQALIADRIDYKKAGLLLYGLQTAATTVQRCDFETKDYEAHMLRYTDHERVTLEEEVDQEIKREQTAERRAAKRAAKSNPPDSSPTPEVPQVIGCPTTAEVPDVAEVAGCPTAGGVPDVGVSTPTHDLPEKKPARGVTKRAFWGVVGAMATQNARECAAEAKRLLEAADHALDQQDEPETEASQTG